MRFYSHRHKKVKKYRKKSTFEYALIFNNSNSLIDYVCHNTHINITHSSLYTRNGYYKLIITASKPPFLINYVVFKDEIHIKEIKQKDMLICKYNAIYKLKRAFKKP